MIKIRAILHGYFNPVCLLNDLIQKFDTLVNWLFDSKTSVAEQHYYRRRTTLLSCWQQDFFSLLSKYLTNEFELVTRLVRGRKE